MELIKLKRAVLSSNLALFESNLSTILSFFFDFFVGDGGSDY